jgi:hypothetical protein
MMKRLFAIILSLFICLNANSQTDTCFTSEEILDISFTLDSLTQLDSINKIIITKQQNIIAKLDRVMSLDSIQKHYNEERIRLLTNNIDLYIKREKLIEPKWYDNNTIWFVGGIITTAITGKLLIDTVK